MKNSGLLLLLLLFASALRAQNVANSIRLGNEFYRLSAWPQAERHYREALKKEPGNVAARRNLAAVLYRQKRNKEAIALLQQLQGPEHDRAVRSVAYYNEGVAHSRQQSLEASIEAYKHALRLAPDDTQARENLQKALRELKKQQQQQQKDQKEKKNNESNMSQKEAERRLQRLQEREKALQQRLKQNNQGGGTGNEW
ncbi:MAG TPA: tetratricopeptide repeat protein [Chitinophagaceae bacterium]|jgi:Ca-activated chloride channel family protein|nr:tetratricopeptide repeat protein [Chitinophagaceae bacterium]